MEIKGTSSIIGFDYFGATVLTLKDWYIATDLNGDICAFKDKPIWSEYRNSWVNVGESEDWVSPRLNNPKVLHIGTTCDLPVDPRDSVIQALAIVTENKEYDYAQDRLRIIQSACGKPIQNKIPNSEYAAKLAKKIARNSWDMFFTDVLPTLVASKLNQWLWIYHPSCLKYLDLRIDMRDCGTILRNNNIDLDNKIILPELLAFQTSGNHFYTGYSIRINLTNSGKHLFVINTSNLHETKEVRITGTTGDLLERMESFRCNNVKIDLIQNNDTNHVTIKNFRKQLTDYLKENSFIATWKN